MISASLSCFALALRAIATVRSVGMIPPSLLHTPATAPDYRMGTAAGVDQPTASSMAGVKQRHTSHLGGAVGFSFGKPKVMRSGRRAMTIATIYR